MNHITFQYPECDTPAVNDVSLRIKNEEVLSIVGVNGSGKSTLIRLLLGIYKPDQGEIFIGDCSINEVNSKDLYVNMSAVFQKYQKYMLTLKDNITISNMQKDVYFPYLEQCMKESNIELDSKTYPNGLDTVLAREFDGVDISGGQWQRIAIARGLYKFSNIIVLDEPTASIDPLEETAVYEKFRKMSKGKTAVLITHRIGSARLADRIIVMDQGKIVEEGTHESLLAAYGIYNSMFQAQMKWYQ